MRLAVLLSILLFSPPLNADDGASFRTVDVRPGDTLWDIANRYLKDPTEWPQIVKNNPQIGGDPTVVLPGMRLKVPERLLQPAKARPAAARAATLTYIEGTVEHRKKGQDEWNPAKSGMALDVGDQIRTGAMSRARMRFPVGAVLNLDSHSLVVVQPPGEKARADLQLIKGKLKALHLTMNALGVDVEPQSADSIYDLAIDQGQVKVDIYRGNAKVRSLGVEVPAAAGQSVAVPDGAAPLAPRKLVVEDAAVAAALEKRRAAAREPVRDRIETSLGTFQIDAAALQVGAALSGFRLQASGTRDFSRVVFDRVFPVDEKVTLRDIPLESGVYWWRVAPVDLLGATGKYGEPRQAALK